MMNPQEVIQRRVALELHEGNLVNLGIGLPTGVSRYVPAPIWQFLFPAQSELPTWQYASARRAILSTDATALVVRRGTPRVGRMIAQGHVIIIPFSGRLAAE